LHLFADAAARWKGVPTRDSLRDVLAWIDSRDEGFDWLVLTGDLAHDEERATYQALRELLGERLGRCRLVPGNHDHRGYLREVFPELVPGGDGPLTFTLSVAGWRLIGLDSHVPGQVSGRIDREQCRWLERELSAHADQPALVFVHHPPVPVGSAWLDEIGLEDPQPLVEVLTAAPQVKAVCAGHVHHESQHRLGQAVVYTTPSTAVQFAPQTEEPRFDAVPPGYRVVTLDGAAYRTEVVRLPELKYPPDPGAALARS
jgi:Icc protein